MGRGRERTFQWAVVLAVVGLLVVPVAIAAPDGSDAVDEVVRGAAVETPAEPPATATATVGDRTFADVDEALAAAEPGETVVLEGVFRVDNLTVVTPDITVRASDRGAVLDGGERGTVLAIGGENVTVEDLWIRNAGREAEAEDAGVFVNGAGATLSNLTITATTYGVWIDGVDDVTVADSAIRGHEGVFPVSQRGNGIHLWETGGTLVENNTIRTVRDGIYYSWASSVDARDNTMSDSRYGVHYMYSDHNRLANNTAVDNDVGYALMVSDNLTIEDNRAVRNAGTSGHGILVKDIERSTIRGNVLVENGNGLYVTNAQDNRIAGNLVLRNGIGVHTTAGSDGQTVVGNSFVHNDQPVLTTDPGVEVWNGTDRGNYWSGASTADLTGDGISELRHRPAGAVEHVTARHPQAAVFAESPAFDAVRLAEDSFPVIDVPGIVDRHPLVESPHDWRKYADNR